jgi:hypothetical protein
MTLIEYCLLDIAELVLGREMLKAKEQIVSVWQLMAYFVEKLGSKID